MKYFLNPIFDGKKYAFNATKKAPGDIAQILTLNDWKKIDISYTKYAETSRIMKYLYILYIFWKVYSKLERGDVLLLQYPYFPEKHFYFLMKLFQKRYSLIILLHDLSELRYENTQDYYPILKLADFVIAHTERMKDYLISRGLKDEKIKILHFFDYLVEKDRVHFDSIKDSVTFAGNLTKSTFLSKIPNVDELEKVHFYLFGSACPTELKNIKNIEYCGKFAPEDLSLLRGKWGLLWDGANISSCIEEGEKCSVGSYLRYNSSHKLSLYIAAQMPIIIWEEASLAKFIVKNHLGVAISSLADIPKAIAISLEQEQVLKKSMIEYSKKVKTGQMLLSVLEQCK